MADSILGLGTDPLIFPFPFDRSTPIKSQFNMVRDIVTYPGTITGVTDVTPYTPIIFEALIYLNTCQAQKEFIQFFVGRRGRAHRFWVPYKRMMLTVVNDIGIGSSSVVVANDRFNLSYRGIERIYLLLRNGDFVTRKVTNVQIFDDVSELISVEGTFPEEILAADVVEAGRILLARFDQDVFDFDLVTDRKASCSVKFMELVREYEEIT